MNEQNTCSYCGGAGRAELLYSGEVVPCPLCTPAPKAEPASVLSTKQRFELEHAAGNVYYLGEKLLRMLKSRGTLTENLLIQKLQDGLGRLGQVLTEMEKEDNT